MPIVQFNLTRDNLNAALTAQGLSSASLSSIPLVFRLPLGLIGGQYKAKILIITLYDDKAGGAGSTNNVLWNISSTNWNFKGNANQGYFFLNQPEHNQIVSPEAIYFDLYNTSGVMDLSLYATGFANTTCLINPAFTWDNTGFNGLILTLSVEPM